MFSYFFFFSSHGHHRDLHSFPTRRSSDLASRRGPDRGGPTGGGSLRCGGFRHGIQEVGVAGSSPGSPRGGKGHAPSQARSEEHTSELQSQSNLVCRLLLEKKKK